MKGSEVFKSTIHAYLQGRAVSDPLFAVTFKKPKKNIDDCVTYILNEVKKSGSNGFADEEIYGMAVHYYDEDNIKIGEKISNGQVVVNQKAEPTGIISTTPASDPPKNEKRKEDQEELLFSKPAPSKRVEPTKKGEAKKEQPNNLLTLF